MSVAKHTLDYVYEVHRVMCSWHKEHTQQDHGRFVWEFLKASSVNLALDFSAQEPWNTDDAAHRARQCGDDAQVDGGTHSGQERVHRSDLQVRGKNEAR